MKQQQQQNPKKRKMEIKSDKTKKKIYQQSKRRQKVWENTVGVCPFDSHRLETKFTLVAVFCPLWVIVPKL